MRPNPQLAEKIEVDPETGCHEWAAGRSSTGYGALWCKERKTNRLAHRVAWELANGPIPEGMQIDHLCRNRCCVNVDHLEVVTPRENIRRTSSVFAENMEKTHCKRGHAFDAANTGTYSDGRRFCRECGRKNWREYYHRNRDRLMAVNRAWKARKKRLDAGGAGQ